MISSCFLRFLPFFSRYRRHCHVTWRNQPLTFHFRLANCPLAYFGVTARGKYKYVIVFVDNVHWELSPETVSHFLKINKFSR